MQNLSNVKGAFSYVLGLRNLPFITQRSLVPGAHKVQKLQRFKSYDFSMYKVLVAWSRGRNLSGRRIPTFLTKTLLMKTLRNLNLHTNSSLYCTTPGLLIQILEASYKSNYGKVFSAYYKNFNQLVKAPSNRLKHSVFSKTPLYMKPGDILLFPAKDFENVCFDHSKTMCVVLKFNNLKKKVSFNEIPSYFV